MSRAAPPAGPVHPLERPYAWLLSLLPPSIHREDAEAIRLTLRDQLRDAAPSARTGIAMRALLRAPLVALRHWMDQLGLGGGGQRGPRHGQGRDGMGQIRRNLRYALRALLRAPTFTLSTVLLVGLGVGTVTAVWTIVDDVVLRPLPYPAADRLVYLTNGSHNGPTMTRLDGVEAFEAWAPTSTTSLNLTRPDGDPLRLRGAETSPAFFRMFGARPALGRTLVDDDRGNLGIAVITWSAWQDVWGARADIVGSTVRLNDQPIEIVGVLAESFVHPQMVLGDPVQLYRPMDWDSSRLLQPGYHAHSVTALLRPGVTLETADQQMDAVARSVEEAYAEYYAGYGEPLDWPLQPLLERTVQDYRQGLLLLLGAVGLLMLVACTNVAHLFMARGLTRGREIAIRRAIGARTGHILGQQTLESVLVGLAGGALGLLFATLGLAAFSRWTSELPRGATVSMDLGVLVGAIALATATALAFGLLPALRTVTRDVQGTLRGSGRGSTGSRPVNALRSGLVVAEVALSLVLVATAGLLMRSFMAVSMQDPGVDAEGVYVVPLSMAGIESADQYRQRLDEVERSIREVPGVTSVAWGLELPFEFVGGDACCMSQSWEPEDPSEGSRIIIRSHMYGGDFFEAMGTEFVAGRGWNEAELNAQPGPAVITEALAIRMYGSAEAAIGRETEFRGAVRIVGVTEPTAHYGLDQGDHFGTFQPIEALTFPIERASIAVRTASGTGSVGGPLRRAIWAAEPDTPVPTITTLNAMIDRSSSARRFGSVLSSTFGVIALLLAAAGLYGTLLYAVGERRRELGIRLALGAGRSRVQGEVLRRGLVTASAGIVLGAALSWYVGRFLEVALFGVSGTDPIALASSAAILLATACVASWVPAARASRTDPLETLKAE